MALFVSPFAQYTDASGNPGSGYKLYFYQTATTTPITIYSDSLFATPTANPAIADSAGQWAAIYVNAGSYKVVMKSAADVTIRTADPVSGAPVSGPASSTDNAVARFDGTTGKILQNSLVIIDDSGNVTGVVGFTATGNIIAVGGAFSGAVSGTTGTFTGAVSGTTGTFTGVVSASNGTAAAPGFKLASSQVGLYRTTSDGGIGFTTAGVSKGAFHSTGFTVALGSSPDQLIDPAGTVVGVSLSSVGMICNYIGANTPAQFGRSNSGDLIYFFTAGVNQGKISEAAGTVTYGAFCGVHWTQWSGTSPAALSRGTVIETKDEMCVWLALDYVDHEGEKRRIERVPEGAKVGDVVDYSYQRTVQAEQDKTETITETVKATVVELPNSTLPKVGLAEPGSKSVYGVFSHFDDDETGDFHVAGLGAYVIRVAKGEKPQKGDLMESNGDGCARVQVDDVIRSSTVAKITAGIPGEIYPDGSYLMPCTLHCG